MNHAQGDRDPQKTTSIDGKRLCRVCHEEKLVSQFGLSQSGRLKSICEDCIEALTAAYYGLSGLRRCATCKKLTVNYRCTRCWKLIRETEVEKSSYDTDL